MLTVEVSLVFKLYWYFFAVVHCSVKKVAKKSNFLEIWKYFFWHFKTFQDRPLQYSRTVERTKIKVFHDNKNLKKENDIKTDNDVKTDNTNDFNGNVDDNVKLDAFEAKIHFTFWEWFQVGVNLILFNGRHNFGVDVELLVIDQYWKFKSFT